VLGPDGEPLQRPRELSPEERQAIEGNGDDGALDQDWLDKAIGRERPAPPPRDPPPPARRQPGVLQPLPGQRTSPPPPPSTREPDERTI
jgi:hypothetical protein